MNDQLSELVCVMDRSGSMDSIRSDAIGGFNSFLADQKRGPGDARLTLVLFDHEYQVRYDNAPIEGVQPLDGESYVPRGRTALLDAVGQAIDSAGQRLADTPEAERPGKVIVAILTDGLENASTYYSRSRIAEMIQHQREIYDWEFLFLGANMDAIQEAQSMSIPDSNAMSFAATGEGVTQAYGAMNRATRSLRKRRSLKSDWQRPEADRSEHGR